MAEKNKTVTAIKKAIEETITTITAMYPSVYPDPVVALKQAETWLNYLQTEGISTDDFKSAAMIAMRSFSKPPSWADIYLIMKQEVLKECPKNEIWNAYCRYAEKISELKDKAKFSGKVADVSRAKLAELTGNAPKIFSQYTGRIGPRTNPVTYRDEFFKYLDNYIRFVSLTELKKNCDIIMNNYADEAGNAKITTASCNKR